MEPFEKGEQFSRKKLLKNQQILYDFMCFYQQKTDIIFSKLAFSVLVSLLFLSFFSQHQDSKIESRYYLDTKSIGKSVFSTQKTAFRI